MNTLTSITGISARIFEMPGRDPFMTTNDLADAYQTRVDAITQAVKRNQSRFPEDFAFRLSDAEMEYLKTQNVFSTKANRALPLVFTHAGALALSGVLKTPVAAEVSVIIHRAFAAMEKQALAQTRFTLLKLRTEALRRSPLRVQVMEGIRAGLDFDAIWRTGSASRAKLAAVIADLLELGLIDAAPQDMPARQLEMFGHG